eukprot:gene21558-25892_t
MPLQIITIGDSTDHGGKVISGSPTHDIGGKAIARLGDEVMCPQRYPGGAPHGVNKIITAHETLTAGGIRCKESEETIRSALVGHYQPEHVFSLKQALALYDFYQQCIGECDAEIERTVAALNIERQFPDAPLPKPKHNTKQPGAPNFDVRSAMYQLTGTDLTQIHGIGPFLALRLIGECGTDLSRGPTAKHFTSWLTLSPGCKISGGKVLSSHTRKTSNRITVSLRLAAVTVGRTNSALGAFYRRLAGRIGNAKAVTATARKIAVLFYNAMRPL